MTKYSIKLGELFGSAYYTYNVYTSSYNVKLDTTIIVTCQVRNIFGNPVSNKELTPTYKGIAQDPVTTNANGMAEWEIDVGTTIGTYKFAINNQYIFINVTGYQTYNGTHYTAKYNNEIVNIDFAWDTTSTFSANTSWTEFTTVTIPSHLQPTESIIVNTHYNGLQINIQPNGVCRWANRSNTSITNPQIHFTVTYRKGDNQ